MKAKETSLHPEFILINQIDKTLMLNVLSWIVLCSFLSFVVKFNLIQSIFIELDCSI